METGPNEVIDIEYMLVLMKESICKSINALTVEDITLDNN